jgi:hypothetical protein
MNHQAHPRPPYSEFSAISISRIEGERNNSTLEVVSTVDKQLLYISHYQKNCMFISKCRSNTKTVPVYIEKFDLFFLSILSFFLNFDYYYKRIMNLLRDLGISYLVSRMALNNFRLNTKKQKSLLPIKKRGDDRSCTRKM